MKRIDIVGAVMTALLVGLAAFFFIGNSMKRVSDLVVEQNALTGDIAYLTALTNTLGEAEVVLDQMHQEIEKVNQHLPDKMDTEDFYITLADLAAESGISLTDMEPGNLRQGDGYVEFPVTVTASGTFPEFQVFLHHLGRQERLTKIDYLSLALTREPDICTARMLIKIYARNVKAQVHGG